MDENKSKESLTIDGMTCSNCANGIQRHLRKNGIKSANVNFISSEATFAKTDDYNTNKVIDLINKLGYKASVSNIKLEEGLSLIEKKFFFTLVFTIPLFSHMFLPKDNILQNIVIQFILCLPVFFVGTWHFGKSAFNSLKTGLPNMDVLILMGSSAAFFYSIYGWILYKGTEEVHNFLFFETTATIITLVLLGNVLEHRSVKQTTTAIEDLSAIKTGFAKKDLDGKVQNIPFEEIGVNDILIVNMGDKIPVDGIVIWGSASIDESMLTGESIAVTKELNENVFGGTIIKSGSIKMQAKGVGDDTLLSQIIELVKNAQDNKPGIQRFGDKVSGIFVPVVLLISILTFFVSHYGFDISQTKALLRSIAVLVISCPCAMGLATPTAVMVGIGRAAKNGILLSGGDTLEKMAGIRKIVFDKTGTITTGNFTIKQIKVIEGENKLVTDIIYNLEKHSSHPLALSLVNELKYVATKINLDKIKEEKGIGVSAYLNNDKYQIGSYRIFKEKFTDEHDLYILKNNKLIAWIDIRDKLKKDAKTVIEDLRAMGLELILLSGDKARKCDDLNKELNFTRVYSEQLPEQKLMQIKKLEEENPTAMFGDGINDAPALAQANVGISISNATQVAIQSADVILLNKNELSQLPKVLQISKHTLITIKQNLFWAFAYNIVAIPVAALGFLNPMWGALFMAFSDVIVIGNSIRLKYKKIN